MKQYTLPHQHNESTSQLLSHFPETESFKIAATIFKQLSDSTRIRIFWIFCHCEKYVINISCIQRGEPYE